MSDKAMQSTVESLRWIYAVIIALSIGEAFKQFVMDPDHSSKSRVQWDRLPSLLSLLITVVPFYQGMTQWFSVMYSPVQTHQPYGLWLLVDCSAFTLEGGLFFVLARSLPKELWSRFNYGAIALLCLDILWGVLAWICRTSSIRSWVIVNICAVFILMGVLLIFRRSALRPAMLASLVVLMVLLGRTVADYWTGWPYYFPM